MYKTEIRITPKTHGNGRCVTVNIGHNVLWKIIREAIMEKKNIDIEKVRKKNKRGGL